MSNQQQPPKSIEHIQDWQRPYLRVEDLNGREFTLTVSAVKMVLTNKYKSNDKVWRPVVNFSKAAKYLTCNFTQARQFSQLAQSATIADWVGLKVTIKPGRANNGKATIMVTRPPGQLK